jgi:hypothetical protein
MNSDISSQLGGGGFALGVPEHLPEQWGGRPKGSSRRSIRMQEEWDKRQERQLKEYGAMRQAYEADRSFYLQQSKMASDAEKEGAVQRLKDQQQEEALGAIQAFNTLDPRSPEYRDQVIAIKKQYPLGSLDPSIAAIFGEYEKANSVYMGVQKEEAAEEKQRQKLNEAFRVQQESTASELGIDTSEFVNPETGAVDQISLMQRIGEARREKTEEAEKRSERKSLDREKRDAAKPLIREIRDINDELEAAELTAQTSKGKVQQEAVNSVGLLRSRLARREGELLTIIGTPEEEPQRPEISKEAVDAARKAIRDNPDSPQAQAARQIIEAYEASQPEQPTGEEGGGETISEPETIPTPTAAAPSAQQPFLSQQDRESIPQTRREFATGEMAENLDTMEEMRTELDRLYKVRFTSKDNMEKYKSLQKELSKKRKEDSKLRAERQKEIREEMKKLGPYSSGENRKKYIALERELRLISGV